jgi:hypothetical protein
VEVQMKDKTSHKKLAKIVIISRITGAISFNDETLLKTKKLSKERKRYIEEVSSKALSSVAI